MTDLRPAIETIGTFSCRSRESSAVFETKSLAVLNHNRYRQQTREGPVATLDEPTATYMGIFWQDVLTRNDVMRTARVGIGSV